MSGLSADIANQTCKTATQSRTLLGHRRIPRTQTTHSRHHVNLISNADKILGANAVRARVE
jgi:hypothetical protein